MQIAVLLRSPSLAPGYLPTWFLMPPAPDATWNHQHCFLSEAPAFSTADSPVSSWFPAVLGVKVYGLDKSLVSKLNNC